MAQPLTGLVRPRDPILPRCACGCGQDADRGFANEVYYLTAHVPPHMRLPWETGAIAAAPEPAPAAAPPVRAPAAPDLFSA